MSALPFVEIYETDNFPFERIIRVEFQTNYFSSFLDFPLSLEHFMMKKEKIRVNILLWTELFKFNFEKKINSFGNARQNLVG